MFEQPGSKTVPKVMLLLFPIFFVMLSCLFLAALWSPGGKGLTSWLSCVLCFIVFCSFLICLPGQVWYLIVSFPDLCLPLYFDTINKERFGLTLAILYTEAQS